MKASLLAEWKLVPGDKSGTFCAGNVSIAKGLFGSPKVSCSTDGVIVTRSQHFSGLNYERRRSRGLITTDGDLPLVTALRIISQTRSLKFFGSCHLNHKISAYRVTPRNQHDGSISVDEERIPFGSFQAEVHEGLGRVISKSGTYEAEGPVNCRVG